MRIGQMGGVRAAVVMILAGGALAPTLANAQQETASEAEETLEEVVVNAQLNNQTQVSRRGSLGVLGEKAAEDVPFSIKSYNAALILNQQPQTLGQVLENDPSIRTTYGYGNAAETFVVRGFALTGDDIGLDGLYGLAPRQLVAPELYDSVQVLNGASAFLNGAAPGGSGIGGSVNLLPKRAGRELQRFTINHTFDGHVGGSFDVARRSADGRFGLRLNGAARRGDVAIDDEFRSAYVLGAAFDYDGGALRLSADLAWQRIKVEQLRPKVALSGEIPRVPDADANYAQPWTYSTLRDVFGMAKLEYDLADNALLYVSVGARDGSEKGVYDGITVVDVDTGDATGSALFVPRTDNNEAATAGVRWKLATGAISHELNLGGSVSWQVNRNAYDFLGGFFVTYDTNLYDTPVVAQPPSGGVGGDLEDPFPVNRKQLRSVFVSDTLGFMDEQVLVTAGARLQQLIDKSYSYVDGSRTTKYDEDAVTPVFGVVVKPAPGISLFANRVQGLVQGPTAPTDATVVNSGEVFAPSKSTQYEVGGKLSHGRLNASAALYQTEQPSAYSVDEPGSPGMVRFGRYGEQRNRGVELSLDGELARGLRLITGLSVNDAKLRRTAGGTNDGNDAPGVPDYLLNANLEWDVAPVPALTLTGRVVRTGKQKVDIANTLELSAWTRVDLGARYVTLVSERPLTLRFNVDNVANERYWASAYDSFVPQLLQGGPRTFKLSASIDL